MDNNIISIEEIMEEDLRISEVKEMMDNGYNLLTYILGDSCLLHKKTPSGLIKIVKFNRWMQQESIIYLSDRDLDVLLKSV